MREARGGDFGQGLMVLGVIGLALNAILLSLDWISFEDRSDPESVLLALSILAVCLGGWLRGSARSAAAGVAAGVFCAALFLFAAAAFAWLKSGYFFPARSRLLLRSALAALLLSSAVLAAALRRRGGP
jgi:hypothetical protein